ncbi:hypothetical protein Nepgr_028946 [Nepenthes gracilis]|uniref:Uncharacterized protein n=1 Tax=Nepenthes gracilis TaxID=150966 RepID=A0AAD3Y2V2_NEPGR|nr:hypothetical protein Nepgr_028946 [Nepenthes gracilis]
MANKENVSSVKRRKRKAVGKKLNEPSRRCRVTSSDFVVQAGPLETGTSTDPTVGLAPPVEVFQEQEITGDSTGTGSGEGVLNETQSAPLPELPQLESPIILANTEENAGMIRIMEERPDWPFTPPVTTASASQPNPQGVQADRPQTPASSLRIP